MAVIKNKFMYGGTFQQEALFNLCEGSRKSCFTAGDVIRNPEHGSKMYLVLSSRQSFSNGGTYWLEVVEILPDGTLATIKSEFNDTLFGQYVLLLYISPEKYVQLMYLLETTKNQE